MAGEVMLGRRRLLAAGAAGLACLATTGAGAVVGQDEAASPGQLEWLPAWRIRELVVNKHLSAVEVLEYFLARIDRFDPQLGSFSQLDRDGAIRAARAADKAVMGKESPGPLHGVPVALKQMVAARGMTLETGDIATEDSIAVARLRQAGAIILGTTVLAGPAAMLGEAQTGAANPWDYARVAGASSSGAAACVAAGFCPVAIGSDGGGSTRLPAAWCGVVGLHPTIGRVPADHDVMRSLGRTSWSATYGPITRDVRDTATVLSVIAGPDWRHVPGFNGPPPDYQQGLADGVRDLRMAWCRDLGGVATCRDSKNNAVLDRVQRSARGFTRLGASVRDVQLDLGDWYPVFTRIAAQFSAGALYPLLAGAARGWDGVRGEVSAPQWTGEIEEALAARQAMAMQLLALLEQHDILITATSPIIAPTREEYGSWLASDSYAPEYTCLTGHMNLLGFPAISLPAGQVEGMPVGMQLVARPDEDALLLRAALAFLQARPAAHPVLR